MSENKLSDQDDKVVSLVLKAILVLIAIVVLYSCVAKKARWFKPDNSKPHEYLRITGYGLYGESMDGNDHTYTGILLRDYKNNFFPIGKGECTKYLNRLTPKRIRISMMGFNDYLDYQNDYNDVRVAKAELRCIEYLGMDDVCVERFANLISTAQSDYLKMMLMFRLTTKCRIENNIGAPKIVLLRE